MTGDLERLSTLVFPAGPGTGAAASAGHLLGRAELPVVGG
jgi:hypothetical protein